MRVLNKYGVDLQDEFDAEQGDGGCSCHLNPPCSYCIHPGNPFNLEETAEAWTEILPAIDGKPPLDTSEDAIIAVGFGSAGYSKDGEELWSEDQAKGENYHTVAMVESMAKDDPDHDWRIYFFGPLWEGEYQRQGESNWVLVKTGQGFA